MPKKKQEKVATTSEYIANENLEKLRKVFPKFVKDGEIDFDALQTFFDKEGILAGEEKYGLNWAGKSVAFKAIRVPATGTLTPQPKESKDSTSAKARADAWDKTENLFIEGDNLEVLKLLQKNYRDSIKMIYIDPPYNTGKDFIYKDNFTENKSDYYERTGQTKGGIKMTTNTESSGRYHSDWLTMMYPRLFLGRNLLKDDGVMFVSIDDNEVANLRMIMDEIFGEENFVESFIWRSRLGKGSTSQETATLHEYIICYAKDINSIDFTFDIRTKEKDDKERLCQWGQGDRREDRPTMYFSIASAEFGEIFPVRPDGSDGRWRASKEVVQKLKEANLLKFEKQEDGRVEVYKIISAGTKTKTAQDSILDSEKVKTTAHGSREIKELFDGKIFDYPKPTTLVKFLLSLINDNNFYTLDFFAGSSTTAHAVMAQNAEDGGSRKWICVQLPEETEKDSEAYKAGYKTIADISRERIRRAGKKIIEDGLPEGYYNGLREVYGYKEGEVNELRANERETIEKYLDLGFKSYKLSQSNYREWNVLTDKDDEVTLKKQLKLIAEKPLVDKYDEEAVVYEVLVKEGFGLNAKVEKQKKGGLDLWRVADRGREMFITFAAKLTQKQVESLALPKDTVFVCLDSALDDSTKVNIGRGLNVKVI
ncbi:MAG: site-specific DNA-methyltransferase [Parcubacteria group bacterium CG_4_9_14_0_2_um_filter_41_8]|nr:MAG: site-specific DNA-methyltransferase [Parcubacteria group bacterium CG11_big_fil_rev_8_21_14_0_20_41_14]PJC40537.1 MAG: site-specific DNA-methyltransferase [Parcubacteria group bacterium CG_4_9_14_0_2_um_filter_41_8]